MNCNPLPLFSLFYFFEIFWEFSLSSLREIPLKALKVSPESLEEFFTSSNGLGLKALAGDFELSNFENKLASFLAEFILLSGVLSSLALSSRDFLPERSLFFYLDSDSSLKDVGLGDLCGWQGLPLTLVY